MTDYTLIRSARKTLSLRVTKDAVLEVRAPLNVPKAEIDRFVVLKKSWIDKHRATASRHAVDRAAFALDYGSAVLIQGQSHTIEARGVKRERFDGHSVFLPPGLTRDQIKRAVVRLYKAVAKQVLTAKATQFATQTGLIPADVRINSAKTRWGSCGGGNRVNFSWRLIMAEEDVIDYVVIHELVHTVEHNHSVRFWAVVERILPDYNTRKAKLKSLQERLSGEDWEL